MKNAILGIVLLTTIAVPGWGQDKYFTRTGHIKFFSRAPLENIEAHNHQVSSIVDAKTGEMAFSALMKGFEFEKALMQQHFNENYVESDKYPKSTFKGKITNIDELDLKKSGEQKAIVEGELTIHGVTQKITVEGLLQKQDENIYATAVFPVKVADYNIKIPTAVINNIAEVIEVTVEIILEPYNQ